MNAPQPDISGWTALVFVGLAFYGVMALLRDAAAWVRGLCRGPLRGWISERHHAKCNPLNKLWDLKVVRHAPTGRVGLCLKVCTDKTCTWREMAGRQRWVAWITWDTELAAQVRSTREAYVSLMLPFGTFDKVPLREVTLAGRHDTAEFESAVARAQFGKEVEDGD